MVIHCGLSGFRYFECGIKHEGTRVGVLGTTMSLQTGCFVRALHHVMQLLVREGSEQKFFHVPEEETRREKR